MRVLLTRPKHDKTNYYLHAWSKYLKEKVEERGFVIYDLEKDKAIFKKLESYLKKQNPDLVIFNGHGGDNCILGHENEILIEGGKNDDLLSNSIVFVRACSCGKILGPKMISSGTKGFIGFKQPYIFRTDPGKFSRPLEDQFAAPCLKASNKAAISLINGHSLKDAYKSSLNFHKEEFDRATSSSGDQIVAMCLNWNMTNMVMFQ